MPLSRVTHLTKVLYATVASPAAAAQAPQERRGQQIADKAMDYFDAGDYLSAAQFFMDAYSKDPDPVYLFDAGRAMQAARHVATALNLYQQYLRREPAAVNRKEVERTIRSLRRQAERTHGEVRFRSAPEGATVALIQAKGLPPGESQWLGTTPLDVWLPQGRVVAKVTLKNHASSVHLIEIEAGSVATVTVKTAKPKPRAAGTVKLIGFTAKSKITVAGETVLPTTGPKILRVSAGKLRIVVKTPGHEPFDQEFMVSKGSNVTVDVGTDPLKRAGAVPVFSSKRDDGGRYTGAGWTIVGIGLAAVAAGVTLHVLAANDGASFGDTSEPKMLGALVSDGVGAVSLITGGILLSF